jgi:hypothetical protein
MRCSPPSVMIAPASANRTGRHRRAGRTPCCLMIALSSTLSSTGVAVKSSGLAKHREVESAQGQTLLSTARSRGEPGSRQRSRWCGHSDGCFQYAPRLICEADTHGVLDELGQVCDG